MEGPEGRLEDLGPLTQERDAREIVSVNLDHVGGLVWGADNKLYLVKSGSGMRQWAAHEGIQAAIQVAEPLLSAL